MNKALNQSMRAILPYWKTSPITSLHRESGIPPIDLLLEARQLRFAARLKSLDKAHPLVNRTTPPPPPIIRKEIKRKYQPSRRPFRTRLRRTDQLLPVCQRPVLLPQRLDHQTTSLQTASKMGQQTNSADG